MRFGDHIPHTPFRKKYSVFSAGFRNFIKYNERGSNKGITDFCYVDKGGSFCLRNVFGET